MNHRVFTAVMGLVTLAVFAGVVFVPNTSAAPGATPMPPQPQTNAWVRMQPQTDLARLRQATQVGQHPLEARIKLTVGMKLRHVAQLKRFLQNVQNPSSPEYHQYLTPQQFTAQYGPSQAQVALVVGFLEHHGIRVDNVSPNRVLIHTEATADAYDHALAIMINDYTLNGRPFFSTTDRPQLPAPVADVVQSILGLDNSQLMRPHSHFRALGSHANGASPQPTPPPATSAYFNPAQIARAYAWPPIASTSNGAGVSIAIVTANAPGFASDTSPHTFWSAYGLPDHTITVTPVDGTATLASGLGETTLDTEYSGAMAPGATLHVYMAANALTTTFTDAYNKFVTADTSQVMTTSFGIYESADPTQFETDENIFMQGAAEGISMFAAAGDYGSGDRGPGNDNADYPSSSVYITAANGSLLTLSDVGGTYGSETAWNRTGGAISQLFARPTWQIGPGVPSTSSVPMRMNSDMALNSGTNNRSYYIVYEASSGFGGVYGTSAVAPILAGLFAIGVSHQPDRARLGQSNELIYNDVNAGNYATDFHDITTGRNGAFSAGLDWDHPTGWGSPIATSFLDHVGIQGPAGTIQGTVSASANGSALAGATVTFTSGNYELKTASDGTYSTGLAVGTYTVTVSDFGYQTQSQSATITNGTTTTTNFALAAVPSVALSGQVTDGSGHGWPLYAEVKVSTAGVGQVADVWTHPTTGQYSVSLPTGYHYTVAAAAYENGYTPGSASLTLAGAATQNFPLTVGAACTAPGYSFAQGFGEDFNGATFPPTGWTVTNPNSNKVIWKLNTTWGYGNFTGGTGTSADADSDAAGSGSGPYDTSLVTPPLPATSLSANAILKYKANYIPLGGDALDLDYSTDGGTTWTTISHWTTAHGTLKGLPGVDVQQPVGSYVPASGSIQFRWRYYSPPTSSYDWYAQIDDVSIGACVPLSGGLIDGNVTAATSGSALIGATVADDTGASATTFANPADPNLTNGLYILFSSTGNRTLTATDGHYSPATASLAVANNDFKQQSFALKSAQFTAAPASLNLHVEVNSQVTKTFTIGNSGTGSGAFHIVTFNAPASGLSPTMGTGAPLHLIQGHFTPQSIVWAQTHGGATKTSKVRPRRVVPPGTAGWANIADLPFAIVDNAGVADSGTGLIYSLDGTAGGADVDSVYAYDSSADSWSPMTNAPNAREAPTAVDINGTIYLANGWQTGGSPTAELDIYDTATDTWTTGAANPVPAGGGSASTVVNGKLYVVGGCNDGKCAAPLSAVQVYDPTTNSWSSAANYPQPVTFAMCGGISGKLYCAGGTGNSGDDYATGYVYDPSSDSWSPIASLPVASGGLFAAGYITSQGELLVSGGAVNGGSVVTNAGYVYDPTSNSWSSLQNANNTLFRGGSACGFYRFGGSTAGSGLSPVTSAEMLPGYSPCGVTGIPWLTVAPLTGTLAAGASAQVTLTFDGTGQAEFTTSKAHLEVTGSPYPNVIVPLTVTWDPQPINLAISGNVSPNGTVKAGDSLTYTLAVQNLQSTGSGAASQTKLTYQVPSGLTYISSNGDATGCTAASGTVTCDLGTIAAGAGALETIVVQTNQDATTVNGTFTVSAREPDSDMSNNSVMLSTNPSAGSPGPTGPTGPKGNGGSGGFGGLALLALLGVISGTALSRRRQRS
ncbi:MAG: protease pro-enzyme activation domain-containing protein [Gammaproteobacteria bacterium]